jgi:KDO2-lipid IV(A) lauroyltransferase
MNNNKIYEILKKVFSGAGYYLGISFAHIIIWFFTLIGHRRTLAIGEKIGNMLYVFSRMKTKVVHNLKFAFGDSMSLNRMEEIAGEVLRNFGKNWTELFYSAGPSKNILRGKIRIEGKENLDMALAGGKGVIAVSAHIGNYALIAQKLTMEGYDFVMVVRDLKNRAWSSVYAWGRQLIGFSSITTKPEREFLKNAFKVLSNNGILCLISDENKRRGGIFVDFFGHPASTAPGPAALALRKGAPVIPVFIVRNNDNSHSIIIEKEIKWHPSGDSVCDMRDITSKFTKVIEDYVRKDLSQWLWTNWRWRTQPWGKSEEAKIRKKKRFKFPHIRS